MRVALISSSSGSRGGGELYLCGLARGLAQLGHEVLSVLSRHQRMDELAEMLAAFGPVSRIEYCNTYDRRLRSVSAVWARRDIRRLTQEIGRLPADVLHVNKQNLEDGLDLLLAVEQTGRPAVATVHVTRTMRGLNSFAAGIRDYVAARTLKALDIPLIAIARSGQADLHAVGIRPDRIHLVWNGVAEPPTRNRQEIRHQWNCGSDDFVLGCVARIEPQKNPLFLPPLLAQLPKHVRLVWIGDGSLREPLEAAIRELDLSDRVVLPGWQTDAGAQMIGFDAFILPSLYEGFPLAILEAMAVRLPCLVSDVDGVAEAVLQGKTGFVCPVNDDHAWLDVLRRATADSASLRPLGDSGYKHYRDHFSMDSMARHTARVYEAEILRRNSPRQSMADAAT